MLPSGDDQIPRCDSDRSHWAAVAVYERVQRLGAGGFGEVWLERDLALNRECAAKYLTNTTLSDAGIDPFREARAMLFGSHKHVVELYSAEMENGVPVIRMEYLPGGSLDELAARTDAEVAGVSRAIEQACRGVAYLHGKHLLHRDIKPANILIDQDGTAKVSDFGLACTPNDARRIPIAYKRHLPPEVDPAPGYIDSELGDVYSLGLTLQRALLPRSPGSSRALSVFSDVHIHSALKRAISRSTHRDPKKRFQSPTDLRHALENAKVRVGWRSVPGETSYAWEGEDLNTGDAWRARVYQNKDGAYSFEISRSRDGSPSRHLRTAERSSLTPEDAVRHVRRVLETVALGRRLQDLRTQ